MKSITLQIDVMNCASYLSWVERALLVNSGVADVSVNLVAETALVLYAEESRERTQHQPAHDA